LLASSDFSTALPALETKKWDFMHILRVKSFAQIPESKKLNAFRVEARLLQPHSRLSLRAPALQPLRKKQALETGLDSCEALT
jgi:hypothetical protein